LRLVLCGVRLAIVRDALVYAAGVAVSPIAIASILLLLTSRGGSANGISFAVGWAAGVAALAGVFAVLVRVVGIVGKHPVWIAIVELVLGGVFVAAAAALLGRQARRQARSLMFVTAAEALTPARAAGLGSVLSAANPKIMALALGAAVTLAREGASGGHNGRDRRTVRHDRLGRGPHTARRSLRLPVALALGARRCEGVARSLRDSGVRPARARHRRRVHHRRSALAPLTHGGRSRSCPGECWFDRPAALTPGCCLPGKQACQRVPERIMRSRTVALTGRGRRWLASSARAARGPWR